MVRVLSHWQLRTDPFEPVVGPFVPLPGASEAVARAAHAVESGERRLRLVAPAGLGKTTVLRTALAEVRRPSRRIATASAASGPEAVLLDLASGLGHRPIGPADGPSAAWKAVRTAVRLARIQGLSVVLAIDDVDGSEPEGRALLDRLAHVDPHPSSRLTILEIGRGPARGAHDPGELAVRLGPLTRGEAEVYVRARLALGSGRPRVHPPGPEPAPRPGRGRPGGDQPARVALPDGRGRPGPGDRRARGRGRDRGGMPPTGLGGPAGSRQRPPSIWPNGPAS